MEFPFGHHHHDHGRNDDEEERREHYPPPDTAPPPPYLGGNESVPPPPHPPSYYQGSEFPPPHRRPYFQENEFAPPPPVQESHVYHSSHNQEVYSSLDYPPPTQVIHVSHEKTESESSHSFRPHLPSFIHHHTHQSGSGSGFDLSNKPSYKVYCKAEPNFFLTIRDGKVILAPSDPSDEFQNWYKDEKYSTRVKDEDGCPCFALVNKATGEAMKHSIGATQPVQLIPYNPDVLDESILWTESKDLGDGYRTVRMVNNIHLNVDAFHGDKKSGGVHNGTTIVLWKWNKGDNQRWRITPH
ncbi:hypothetical protein P3X46_008249 [Hevea brasiliensis]|uniref:Ricin B lectin domain-containing protein n=1 Tax=Hevea brasiliensis TaxID=3981 RepID=A0ABQ9MHY0_HEVBR|nr:ricin B-like lectin R40G3 [Hevea brasiliensis]KAJ9179939.1 hypothetical protein P3X46_008249 [Hevea brasiliensis]